jgi:hypothetical protein
MLCNSLAYLGSGRIPLESPLSRWIPSRLAKEWRRAPGLELPDDFRCEGIAPFKDPAAGTRQTDRKPLPAR